MEREVEVPAGIIRVMVESTRKALGPLAHVFFGKPSEGMPIIGVTGTNGKTTVAWLIRHLIRSAGILSGLIGTVANDAGKEEQPATMTTPGPIALHQMFSQMRQMDYTACVMEASSHALDQFRPDGIRWQCGIFTNLTPEHLDYHGTMERYFTAKKRLFENRHDYETRNKNSRSEFCDPQNHGQREVVWRDDI